MGDSTGGLVPAPALLRTHDEDTPGEYHQAVRLSGSPREDIKHGWLGLARPGWGGNINVNCKKHSSKIINNDAIFLEINVEHCHYYSSPQHNRVSLLFNLD